MKEERFTNTTSHQTGAPGRPGRIRQVGLIVVAGAVLSWCAAASARSQSPFDYFPTNGWRASSPEEQGLDRKRLKKLVKKIRRNDISGIDSLLIVRNGYLVSESYFNGWGPDDLHTLQSDTKSITSLLVGIARQQGFISSVDQNVVSFFPEYPRIKRMDDRKAAMSLRDLLTMRTGFDWSEDPYEGSPLFQLNNCGCDWLKFTLDWRMREQPGTRFEYNSGGVILLGGVIRNVSATPVDTFAQRYLFDPLGITRVRWYYGSPDNLPHMGGGLNLRPLDMAKIGYLVLRRGRWADQQVVSEEWIAESLQHSVAYPRTFAGRPVDYGYLWWLLHIEGEVSGAPDGDIYTAAGAQGQWIFIIPKYDMVVVSTGSTAQFDKAVGFLYSDILRAVN
ncbi:MAG TPA: serine hydrolase [Blastocatellia bacterium]|nr:serine hydrolase [Blastocatellia bacterium]